MKNLKKKNIIIIALALLLIVIIFCFIKSNNNTQSIIIKYSKTSEYYDEYSDTVKIEVTGENHNKIAKYLNKIKYEGSIDIAYRKEALLIINDDYSITIGEDLYGLKKDLKTNKTYIVSYPKELYDNVKAIIKNGDNKDGDLAFVLKSSMLNCESPILKVFKDNTYEYYESYSTDGEGLIPKKGTYNYNIDSILNNIDNVETGRVAGYTLEYNGTIYSLEEGFAPVEDFLNSIGIQIHKCIHEDKNLLFTLQSTMLKCPSPVLKVYDDNTYELFDTISFGNEEIVPKEGIYNYDIYSLLNNFGEHEHQDNNTYALTDNSGVTHYFDDNYTYLNEFLASINVDMHRCSGVN